MELEEAVKDIKDYIHDWTSSSVDEDGYEKYSVDEYSINFIKAVETVLQALERYKRLADANLKDSEEFQNNLCEHRCILKSELQELQENSIPKKKIENILIKYKPNHTNTFIKSQEKYIKLFEDLQELLEDK